MVKTVELMGLATFNIFVALTLSATVLSGQESKGAVPATLTESTVTTFVNDVATISGGLKSDMDEHNIVEYFLAHMTENGRIKAAINYKAMGDEEEKTRDMDMERMEYISFVLQGLKAMKKHEARTEVNYIKVADDGLSAHVITTNYERGTMPTQNAFGDDTMIPVIGTSYCEQNIVLNAEKIIQLDGADCVTTINFEEAF